MFSLTQRPDLALTSPRVQGFTRFNISTTWELSTTYCNGAMPGTMPGGAAKPAPSTYVYMARSRDVQRDAVIRLLSAGEWHA